MIEDYSIETVLVGGHPVQTFTHRFKSLPALFAKSVAHYGERPFLVEGDWSLTFRETEDRVWPLAARLESGYNIRQGSHVGLLMENSIPFILAFLAIQQLGATAVVFNHHLTASELRWQIERSNLALLILSPTFSEKVETVQTAMVPWNRLTLDSGWITALPGANHSRTWAAIDEDDVALILFTSGTTGLPKGTMITHRNLITSACKQGYALTHYLGLEKEVESKTILAAPLFHVMAIQELLMGAIFNGTTLFILPAFKADRVLDLIVRERITILGGTPTMYWLLLHKTDIQRHDVRFVKAIKFGGAPMPPDLLAELKALFPEVRFVNGYGLTEASVITLLGDEYREQRPTSVGRPALCSEVRLVDPYGEEVEANRVGELTVRGGLVSKGYYKQAEETQRAYRSGWFFTGDLGIKDEEGFITLVGRRKEMISRGGEKVYPVEVENVIHLHPKILDVSVFGLPDPVMGEAVACAAVLRPGVSDLQLAEIQEFCRDRLAYYKIPQKSLLVAELPRNHGGKVIKKALVAQFLENGTIPRNHERSI